MALQIQGLLGDADTLSQSVGLGRFVHLVGVAEDEVVHEEVKAAAQQTQFGLVARGDMGNRTNH